METCAAARVASARPETDLGRAILAQDPHSPGSLFNLRGHGQFGMQAYLDHQAGKLRDEDYDPAKLEASLAQLPRMGRNRPPFETSLRCGQGTAAAAALPGGRV